MKIDSAIEASLRNIASHGDTDIFPFPFENLVFYDKPKESQAVLKAIHTNFYNQIATSPPETMPTLAQVGYTGFRWATLIDPFWNAYYLALVISLAQKIEDQRIPETEKVIFSYRFNWQDDEAKIFKDSTWNDFRKQCLKLSEDYPIVVQTDISDFYPRIYHHRLENALNRLPEVGDTPKRIMALLNSFSKNVSYGLPVGGPASRLLSELALNGVDTLLVRKGIKFCRYADDYAIFCEDKSDAYRILVFLSEKLMNEGLVLQKKKTRIISAEEFRQTAQLLDPADANEKLATEEQKLLNISLRFDPYSPNAEDEYEELKDAIEQIDIIGILGREIGKTTIDSVVAKHAVQAVLALNNVQQQLAVEMLLEYNNLMTLAPVFVTVMRVVREIYSKSDPRFQAKIDEILCELSSKNSPLLSVEVNLSYYIKALSGNRTLRKEEILGEVFDNISNPMIRRLIMLTMANWNCHYWLTDIKNRYGSMALFERRAFIISSYSLGDEGKHWRDNTKPNWAEPELLIRNWHADRFQKNKSAPV